MKYINTNRKSWVKQTIRTLSFVFVALVLTSCSKKITFPVSDVVPAAQAVMHVDADKNKNYEVKLEVKNLAEPDRLSPSRKHYVVWMVTKRNGTINIGNLNIGRKNKGELKTTSPYEPIRVFITAEDERQPSLPSTQMILNSEDFKV